MPARRRDTLIVVVARMARFSLSTLAAELLTRSAFTPDREEPYARARCRLRSFRRPRAIGHDRADHGTRQDPRARRGRGGPTAGARARRRRRRTSQDRRAERWRSRVVVNRLGQGTVLRDAPRLP